VKRTTGGERQRLERLYGKTAIANARLAYQSYKRIFAGPRWEGRFPLVRGAGTMRRLRARSTPRSPFESIA